MTWACELFGNNCTVDNTRSITGWGAVGVATATAAYVICLGAFDLFGDTNNLDEIPAGNIQCKIASAGLMMAQVLGLVYTGIRVYQHYQQPQDIVEPPLDDKHQIDDLEEGLLGNNGRDSNEGFDDSNKDEDHQNTKKERNSSLDFRENEKEEEEEVLNPILNNVENSSIIVIEGNDDFEEYTFYLRQVDNSLVHNQKDSNSTLDYYLQAFRTVDGDESAVGIYGTDDNSFQLRQEDTNDFDVNAHQDICHGLVNQIPASNMTL